MGEAEGGPHTGPNLRTQLARSPPSPPKCPLLCCFAGVDWATRRPRPGFQIAFSRRIQIHGGVAGLVLLVPSFSFSFGLFLCICFCLDQEPASCIAPPVCCSLDFDLLLLPACSAQPLLLPPPPSFEIPTRHSDPSRRVAARDSLDTTRPPPDPRSQTFKCITTRWVNHG